MCVRMIAGFEGRTGKQCSRHYNAITRRRSWSEEEDRLLEQAVESKKGPDGRPDWVLVANMIPGRSAKQCRSHYYKTPDRPATTGRWNEEEDRKLELAVAKYKRADGRPDWVGVSYLNVMQ